jgi:hypothetical protein
MNKAMVIAAAALMLGSAVPAEAGCIKGAIIGGIAGHFAHHMLLGALSGCVIGKVAGGAGASNLTYADVGTMLGAGGSEPDWSKVATAPRVEVVRVSRLKGYIAHDRRMQTAIDGSADIRSLEGKIAGNGKLTAKLRGDGDAPGDVIAAAVDDSGVAYLFVNK